MSFGVHMPLAKSLPLQNCNEDARVNTHNTYQGGGRTRGALRTITETNFSISSHTKF